MQRGMLSLSKDEVSFVLEHLKNSAQKLDNLTSRLMAASTSVENINEIEVSEDEVEAMADVLPPPTANGDPKVASIRLKLTNFLGQFRY